jgi:hypothetical protein
MSKTKHTVKPGKHWLRNIAAQKDRDDVLSADDATVREHFREAIDEINRLRRVLLEIEEMYVNGPDIENYFDDGYGIFLRDVRDVAIRALLDTPE